MVTFKQAKVRSYYLMLRLFGRIPGPAIINITEEVIVCFDKANLFIKKYADR